MKFYYLKKHQKNNVISRIAVCLTISLFVMLLSPYNIALAACTITGNVANCNGDRDASHALIIGSGTGINSIVVDPNSVLTDSSGSGALIQAIGTGPLDINIGQGTVATGGPGGGAGNPRGVVRVLVGNDTRSSGDVNIVIEDNTQLTTGTGGRSAGVYVQQVRVDGDLNITVRGDMNTSTLGTGLISSYFHNAYIAVFSGLSDGAINATLDGASFTAGSAAMPTTNAHGALILKNEGKGKSTINIVNSDVKTAGAFSHGAYITIRGGNEGDGEINVVGSTINIDNTSELFGSYGMFLRAYTDGSRRVVTSDTAVNFINSTLTNSSSHDIGVIGGLTFHQAIGDTRFFMDGGLIDVKSNGVDGAGYMIRVVEVVGQDNTVVDVLLDNGLIKFDGGANGEDSGGFVVRHGGQGGEINFFQSQGHTIETTGNDSSGVVLEHTGSVGGEINAIIDGKVDVSGTNSHGVYVSATNDSEYLIAVGDGATVIGGSGPGAAAIKIEAAGGGLLDIGAGAIIDGSASGIAIRDGDADGDGVDEVGGDINVSSRGNITGDVVLGHGNDFFAIQGGVVDGDIYGDDKPVAGIAPRASAAEKATGDGNDTLVFSGGSFNGTFFGQGGDDVVLVTGNPNFTTNEIFDGGEGADDFIFQDIDLAANSANIRDFERVFIDGGTISFIDSQLNTEETIITNGGVLDAGNAFLLNSDLFTNNGGIFDGTGGGAGVYEITGNVVNDGIISTRDGAVGDKVNVAGNYTGNGVLDVDVDTDSETADQLVIAGNSAGAATAISANNIATSGVGKNTGTGVGNGIPVVLVGGNAQDGDFALQEDLIVGAYQYKINREGDNTFYLQSELLPQVVAAQSLPAVMRSSVSTVPSSPIRQTASLNTLRQPVDSLRERVGDCNDVDYTDEVSGKAVSSCHDSYSWIRVERSDLDMNLPQANQQKFTETQRYVHFGYDVELAALMEKTEPTNWLVGFNAAFGDSVLEVQGNEIAQKASVEKEYAGFGVSATRYTQSGLYADFILQYTDHDSEISSARGAHTVDGQNVAISGEVGKKIYVNEEKTLSITPQVQLIQSRTDFDTFVDDDGVVVSNDDGDTTTARLGLLFEKRQQLTEEMKAQGTKPSSAYLITNVYSNLDNKTAVNASGTHLEYEDHDSWIGAGIGGNLNLSEDVNMFGEVNYNQSLDDFGDSDQISGTIGVRKTWKATVR